MKKRAAAAIAVNLLIFALVVMATVMMMAGLGGGRTLTAGGLRALRYFTVLSNLLMGLAALVYALLLLPVRQGRRETVQPWAQTLLLMGTASVALTFLVTVGFLWPLLRLRMLFEGPNFWFHLLVPLLSAASYLLLDRFGRTKKGAALLGAVPMLIYGVFYVGNCVVNGVGDYGHDPNDWYHFLSWGYPVGVGIFLGLIGVTVGVAALLQLGNRRIGRKTESAQD